MGKYLNQKLFLTLVSIGGLAAAAPALATTQPSLDAYVGAGACGGSIGCFTSQDHPLQPATSTDSVSSVIHSTLADGSYADATASASFGTLHAFADAYRAPPGVYGDAQAGGIAEFIDIIPASQLAGGTYHLNLALDGTHTPNNGYYGVDVGAYISYYVFDSVSNAQLAYNFWQSSDANPTVTLLQDFTVAAGHGIKLQVDLTAHAYTINYYGTYPVTADYSHTLHAYLGSDNAGDDLTGLSGHNYTGPSAAPEPSAWALMLTGFGGAGALLRRRRQALPAA